MTAASPRCRLSVTGCRANPNREPTTDNGRSASLAYVEVAPPKEVELGPVVVFSRRELGCSLVVGTRRDKIADGLGDRAEVEVERGGIAMTDRRGLPDGAGIFEALGADHGEAFFE